MAGNDVARAAQSLRKFKSLDNTFGETRGEKFARELVDSVDAFDSEIFATAYFEYDRISKVDPCKTSILVKGIEEGLKSFIGDSFWRVLSQSTIDGKCGLEYTFTVSLASHLRSSSTLPDKHNPEEGCSGKLCSVFRYLFEISISG